MKCEKSFCVVSVLIQISEWHSNVKIKLLVRKFRLSCFILNLMKLIYLQIVICRFNLKIIQFTLSQN